MNDGQVLDEQARALLERAVEQFAEEAVAFRWVEAERAARVAFAAMLLQEGDSDA